MALQITAPPTVEPVAIEDVKARLRLASTDDDAAISTYIIAAREHAENISRRSLAGKTYLYTLDSFPCPQEPIRVPAPPIASVTAVRYYDRALTQQTWDPAEYFTAANQEPALIVPKPGNTYPDAARVPGAVEVAFVAGPDVLPTLWRQNIVEIAAWIYDHPAEAIPAALVTIPKIYVF